VDLGKRERKKNPFAKGVRLVKQKFVVKESFLKRLLKIERNPSEKKLLSMSEIQE